jgi:signal transduction histidine kinase
MTKVENQAILTGVSSFNLSEQIRSAVLLLEAKWTKKGTELALDFAEYTVEANEEQLKQVWINLLDNAIKFTPQGGRVAVEISEAKDSIRVAVSNTGKEIPPEKLGKVFNKFYKGEESRASEGNGIGLALVRRIVDLHCGEVSAQSRDGITTFTVVIPKRH